MYNLKLSKYCYSDDNLIVHINLDDNISFVIVVDSNDYNIIGFLIDTNDLELLPGDINNNDYVDVSVKFEYNSTVVYHAVKPNIENEFISSRYIYFDTFREWYENIDKHEFKKRIVDILI